MDSGKTYRINEIFYSLQGEGRWTGTPMVFVRFSGCNLRCPFCDTDFSSYEELTLEEMAQKVTSLSSDCRRICLTGGEPTIQADGTLISKLHALGYKIHMETNGTHPVPDGIDWVTVSPKEWWCGGRAKIVLTTADEIKIVYDRQLDLDEWAAFPAKEHFLQPCSGRNTAEVIAYVLAHPSWRLSLQTHKLVCIR